LLSLLSSLKQNLIPFSIHSFLGFLLWKLLSLLSIIAPSSFHIQVVWKYKEIITRLLPVWPIESTLFTHPIECKMAMTFPLLLQPCP
jgi:hypothetical protein